MQIRQLILRGFMRHRDLTVNLPQAGVMLITGKNGVGKSSLVEAISYGLWGRTLRGTDPWPEGGGELTVMTDKLTIVRQCTKGGKKSLSWGVTHEEPHKYSTPTKAQEALDHVVGPWEVWRRTSVFSSQDAAHFTMSTDAERKRLLEALLGLERFDKALDACRVDLRKAEGAHAESARALDDMRLCLLSEERRLAEATALLGGEAVSAASPANTSQWKAMAETARKERDELLVQYRKLDTVGVEQEAEARELARRVAQLRAGKCPTCGQDIPGVLVQELSGKADILHAESARCKDKVKAEHDLFGVRIGELEEEWRVLTAKIASASAEAGASKQAAEMRSKAARMAKESKASLEGLRASIAEITKEAKQTARAVRILGAVEFVLGLRGVRAQVLGHALSGVEAAANMWLARIAGGGLRLLLSPCQEKKTGGTIDAIALAVEGAGGGQGYKGASGGERRRIDVAILMALAEVAGAGKARGLVAFDEVFDALDSAGVEAVSGVLADLAGARPVMLITHSEALIGAVQAAQTLRM
jgi:DNA repair exonuclease SbcCD ATPase subunit